MDRGTTVRDIARRLLAARPGEYNDDELQRATDQVRYWGKIDALTPKPGLKGTGNWKTYDEETVYTAAVLAEISKYMQRWAFLTTVGQYVWSALRDWRFSISPSITDPKRLERLENENEKKKLILAARRGEPDIYLGVSSPSIWDAPPADKSEVKLTAAERAIPKSGRLLVTKGVPTPPPCTSMIIVNLSEIFELIRSSSADKSSAGASNG